MIGCFLILAFSPLLVAIARDLLAYKRVHPVYIWVGGLLVAFQVMIVIGSLRECGLATRRTVVAWRSLGLIGGSMRRSKLTIAALSTLTLACGNADREPNPIGGQTRTYYIAADELDWDFAPSGTDQIHGEKYHFQDNPNSKGMLNPNATTYRKALFQEYTDATFGTLKPRPDAWAHLGALAPLIRAEVGDTITVVFKNNASRAYPIHPHGVVYKKDAEGAGYQDGSPDTDKKDDAVAPGGTFTYAWTVPEKAGPTSADGSTALWLYHSHVDEGRDINSGLIGPLIVTRRGMARPDASPTDVDREFVAQFGLYDEHLSWYWDFNLKRLYGDPQNYAGTVEGIHDFHHFWTVNGLIDGNGPMLTMRQGERVRW